MGGGGATGLAVVCGPEGGSRFLAGGAWMGVV